MVNLIDLIETEDTTMTDPGGYFGPEVNAFGVVVGKNQDALGKVGIYIQPDFCLSDIPIWLNT
jgi:hypothetical protein